MKSIINLLQNVLYSQGFPGDSVRKNLPATAGYEGDVRMIPRSGRSPGVGNGNPLQYSFLDKNPWTEEYPWTEEPGGLQSMGPQRVRQANTYIKHYLKTK